MLRTPDDVVSPLEAPRPAAPAAAYQQLLASLTEPAGHAARDHDALRCATCGRAFDFAAGERAVVVRHVAYYHDLVHDGACLAAARERLFPEPGYDGPAFGQDSVRRRILAAAPATGWAARRATQPEPQPLRWWVLVEHADGTPRVEGLTRDSDWEDEPGALEFPEASRHPLLAYVSLEAPAVAAQAAHPTLPALLAA